MNNSTPSVNSCANDYIAGSTFVVVAGVGLVIYIPIMIVLMNPKYKNDFSSPFYTIVKSLGFSDVFSLLLWMLLGIHTVTHGLVLPTSIVAYIFWLLLITWVVLIWHLVLMSLDRYVAICHVDKRDKILSGRNTLILIGFNYFFAWWLLICFVIPENQFGYSFSGYYPTHKDSICISVFHYFDYTECPVSFVFCLISQILVIRGFRAASAVQNLNEKTRRIREFRIFIQTVLLCSAFFICDLLYYTVWLMTDDIWINFYTGIVLWEVNNMAAAVIYITFNSSVRDKVGLMLLGTKKSKVSKISVGPSGTQLSNKL